MAVLVKAVRSLKTINNLTKLLTNFSLSLQTINNPHTLAASSPLCRIGGMGKTAAFFHTSENRMGLMEFFDDEKNWGQNEVKTGRSWRKDELRLKSNQDLHKLWYILLKERNMLLTMEEHCKKAWEIFPNPERIDKVQDSMENIESVVRERNRAYWLLETGETGERPEKTAYSQIGYRSRYRMRQHCVPKFMNTTWHATHKFGFHGYAVSKFRRLLNEVKWNKRRRALNQDERHATTLIRKFPNMDMEALKEKYPKVDIEELKRKRSSRGHYVPK